nr:ribonuclease H-like domain-containing protein [Tanacetum cinerariifolium]
MTDYSLWEVILNGDSPAPTRVVDGVLQPVAPTTDEHSLPSDWRTHTLIWRNKTDLEEQSLDNLFNSLKIYEAEVKSFSSASTTIQNIAFVSSSKTDNTNELVSATASVFAVSAKILVSSLPNVNSLRRNLGANRPTSMGFDMSKVEFYNCYRKGHSVRECRSPKDTKRNGAAESQRRNVPAETFTSNALVSQCDVLLLTMSDESLPSSPIYDRYQSGNGYHVIPPPYTGTFMPPKPDLVFNNAPNDVETDHPAFTIKLSPSKPDQDLSHTYRPSTPIIEDWHVETSIPTATSKTAILNPISNGKCKNRKPCFVCKGLDHLIKDYDYHDKKMAQTTPRNTTQRGTHKQYAQMTLTNPQRHVVLATVLPQSKLVPITAVRPVSIAVPKPSVTRQRHDKLVVTKTNSPPRRLFNRSPSPKASNSPPKVTAVKAPMVNAAQGVQGKWEWKPKCLILDHVSCNTSSSMTLKRFDYNDVLGRSKSDKGVIDSGCSMHLTGNMSYLSNFEELNGGYVFFGGNPKGGKISGKGKIRTGKLYFGDVYFDKELKFNLFSVSQMCDKKNSGLFTDTECLVLSPDFKLPDENQVLLRVPRKKYVQC